MEDNGETESKEKAGRDSRLIIDLNKTLAKGDVRRISRWSQSQVWTLEKSSQVWCVKRVFENFTWIEESRCSDLVEYQGGMQPGYCGWVCVRSESTPDLWSSFFLHTASCAPEVDRRAETSCGRRAIVIPKPLGPGEMRNAFFLKGN